MPWLRKIIFYIFALIYLILCPLIVARMLGFGFNPLTYQIIKTGLIYISTNPPNATVYIDGQLAHQTTPTVLKDLLPGEHFIRVELSGYNDWERHIPIVAKKATVLANTLLIPEEWPISAISQKPYQNLIYTANDILIATNPVLKNIDVYHTTQSITENINQRVTYDKTPLFSENSIYARGNLVRLFNTPQSPFILLEINIDDKHKFLWVNLKEDPPIIEDVSDLFPTIPNRIVWDKADNDNVFAFYPQTIYRINIKDKAIFLQDADSLPASLSQQPTANLQEEFLINDSNDLLTREGKWIRLYPKENFGVPEVYTIAESKPSANMYFEEKNGELFYLDEDTHFLTVAQILPYHPILNIPIPDALRSKST